MFDTSYDRFSTFMLVSMEETQTYQQFYMIRLFQLSSDKKAFVISPSGDKIIPTFLRRIFIITKDTIEFENCMNIIYVSI